MPRVLIVEDDRQIARALAVNLRARHYEVDIAADGASALHLAAHAHPDLVLLDLGLPDMSGVDVIAGIRGWSRVPILIVSARQESRSKVEALDAGADDYVTKPFGMDELLARLRAALRRSGVEAQEHAGVVDTSDGRLHIDLGDKLVTVEHTPVRLTPIEWRIIEVLAASPGRLVSQRELLREVWGPGYEQEAHYLRVYLSQLRRKLEVDSSRPRYLMTELGMGYRFTP